MGVPNSLSLSSVLRVLVRARVCLGRSLSLRANTTWPSSTVLQRGGKTKTKKEFHSLSFAVQKQKSSSLSLSLKSISSLYDSKRAHKKIYAASLSLSHFSARVRVERWVRSEGKWGLNFLLFSQRGWINPRNRFLREFFRSGRERGPSPSKSAAPRGRKTKQNKSKAKPPKRERKSRDQSLMKREKRAKPYARTEKSTP